MWIDEYIEIMTKEDITTDDIKKARLLKNEHVPKRLYKYRNVTEYSLDNIKNSTVWLSNAFDFNDPFDSAITFDAYNLLNKGFRENIEGTRDTRNLKEIISDDELKRIKSSLDPLNEFGKIIIQKDPKIRDSDRQRLISIIGQVAKGQTDEMVSYFNKKMQKSIRVCCLTEKNDSIIMWSHYANCHNGICVEYEIDSEHFKNMIFPVIYSEKLFDMTNTFEKAQTESFNNLFATVAAMYKSPEWSYEKEWRIILPMGENSDIGNIAAPKIKSITLGSKISNENENKIIEIANTSGIECYKMKISNYQFKLIPEKIK